jgi:hypothetical protein
MDGTSRSRSGPEARWACIACRIAAIVGLCVVPKLGSALELNADVAAVYTDTSFSTPTGATIIQGVAFGDVNVGNGLLVTVDVGNSAADQVEAVFASIAVDPSQLAFLGGVADDEILVGGTTFSPTSISEWAAPQVKASDATGGQIHAVSHVSVNGTDGVGPDVSAVQLFFEVLNVDDPILITLGLGDGDGIHVNGEVVTAASQSGYAGALDFDSTAVYAPEPAMAPLLLTGVLGIVVAERMRDRGRARSRRRSRRARRPAPPGAGRRAWTAVAIMTLAFLPSMARAVDTDGDTIDDADDNCILVANGPNEGPSANQLDSDEDGFGNACDGDFDQDGYVEGLDAIFYFDTCLGGSPVDECDLTGDGASGFADDTLVFSVLWNQQVGPSGLACATIPPVDVGMGDPPCTGP